jgi:four helix bundle protein
VQAFRNLKAWEKPHLPTLDVYRCSKLFPKEELYGLTSQMRRATVSIGANIAEGVCRNGDADFARFIQMAAGSASELEYHLLVAHDLDLLKNLDYQRLSAHVEEVKRMLVSLLRKLRAES